MIFQRSKKKHGQQIIKYLEKAKKQRQTSEQGQGKKKIIVTVPFVKGVLGMQCTES